MSGVLNRQKLSTRGSPCPRKEKRNLWTQQTKVERLFTELLKQAGIREGSPEWKNAWKAFYSA